MRLYLFLILLIFSYSQDLKTHFEKTNGLESSHPKKVISYYESLSNTYSTVKLKHIGEGDSGHPIYNIIVSSDGINSAKDLNGRAVIYVLNGIHSGEACGIDATQMLVRDLAQKMEKGKYKNIVFVTVPVFNVGGHTNFTPYNRVNQNGPKEMGFRANSKNLNLNRDFMKGVTKNLASFYKSYHQWKPHIFIDNHSTNGADYQSNLTYMVNETDDTVKPMRDYMKSTFLPHLEKEMAKQNDPVSPYINLRSRGDISKGINYYLLTGRFSTTYTSFFNSISVLVETHMLKSYKNRVESNERFMWVILNKANNNTEEIKSIKEQSDRFAKSLKSYGVNWKLNREKYEVIDFLGFEYKNVYDKYSDMKWVKYDTEKPITFKLPYYKSFSPQKNIALPKSYIIPRAWEEIALKIKQSGVKVQQIQNQKVVSIEEYKFTEIKWRDHPFENVFLPKSFTYNSHDKKYMLQKGDYIVEMNQSSNRYIIEALEPDASDSFFRWGMFNSVFSQIEYFSPYLFVEKVEEIFKEDPQLKSDFYKKVKEDVEFAKNGYRRLNFIYKRSKYAEKDFMVYPIKRIK